MRSLTVAALLAAITTFVAALALRAPDATVSVLATAAVAVLVTWIAALHTTEEESGLALSNPAAAVTLALVGRQSTSFVLPIIAAQVVGAVLGGLAALGLDDRVGGSLVWSEPSRVGTGVVVAVLAILAAWVVLAVDGGEHPAWAAAPPLLAGASLGVGLAMALNPAAVIGLATAGLLSWTTAGIAAGAGLIASAIGAYAITLVTPAE
jgi:glycerol uptake facilitator-like aquaporin